MAFRARKIFKTFEKRGPGQKRERSSLHGLTDKPVAKPFLVEKSYFPRGRGVSNRLRRNLYVPMVVNASKR